MISLRSLLVVVLLLAAGGWVRAQETYTLTVTVKKTGEERQYKVPGFTEGSVGLPIFFQGRSTVIRCTQEMDAGKLVRFYVALDDCGLLLNNGGMVRIFDASFPFVTGRPITVLEAFETLTVQFDGKKAV